MCWNNAKVSCQNCVSFKLFFFISCNPKELSPRITKEKHMILPMDLMDTDKHPALVEEVLNCYKKVSFDLHHYSPVMYSKSLLFF